MTGPDTLPPEEEEIPDTDPAPMVLPRAVSLPDWPEETPTAVQCPHPPGESR
jgi:hypothetical protein